MKSYVGSLTFILCSVTIILSLTGKVSTVTVEDLKEIQEEITEIQREYTKLNSECECLKKENKNLWSQVNHLSAEVKDLQQYTRVDNLEISGIPQLPDENIYEILKKVCAAIGVEYNRNDISEAHRLPASKQGYPYIIVRFLSRRVRDKWLTASKANVGNVKQIYPDLPSNSFFINQHLTSYKKGLLDMAKRLMSEGVYSFAWVKDGKVFVRKTPYSKIIRVRTYEDFDQSIGRDNSTSSVSHSIEDTM